MSLSLDSGRKGVGKSTIPFHGIMILMAAVLFLGSPRVLIAESNDTATGWIDADRIVFNTMENSAEFIGNAKMILGETVATADNIKAFFKEIARDESPLNEDSTDNVKDSVEKIVIKDNIKIVSENRVATGDKAVYDSAMESFVLTGNPATLVIGADAMTPAEIKAEKIVFSETEFSAEFFNNVRITQGETVITADNVKAFLKKSVDGGFSLNEGSTENIGDSVEKIVSRGNVKIVSEDRVATGDEAIYDSAAGSFVLTGDQATLVNGVYTFSAPVIEMLGSL